MTRYFADPGWYFGIVAAGPVLDAPGRAGLEGGFVNPPLPSDLVPEVLVGSLAVVRNERRDTLVTLLVTARFGRSW